MLISQKVNCCSYCPQKLYKLQSRHLQWWLFVVTGHNGLFLLANTGLFLYTSLLLADLYNSTLILIQVVGFAAKLFFKASKCDHVQPFLQFLHCLPVQARTEWKLSTICHFSDLSLPVSLTFLLCTPLQCSFVLLLTRRYFTSPMFQQKNFGQHCFYCAPKQWNLLPSHAFKHALKTHLYEQFHKWFQILS